jgi:hypothetical protein
MFFVPIVPSTPTQQQVSARARELSSLLSHAVREYRSRNPDVSSGEIRQAFSLSSQDLAKTGHLSSGSDAAARAVAIGLALLLAGGLAFFLVAEDVEVSITSPVWVAVGIAVLGAVAGLLAVVKSGRR